MQILPGSIFVGNMGEGGADNVDRFPSHIVILVTGQPYQILPGLVCARKICKIIVELMHRISAICAIATQSFLVDLRLVNQIPTPLFLMMLSI